MVDLQAQLRVIRPEIDQALGRVLDHAGFIGGREVRDFESAFAQYCGVDYGIGVASGTAALQLALEAADIGIGDEVITTPFTFFATAEAIVQAGATPVFADVDRETLNIDPLRVAEKVTARTKAIIPVHLFGRPADMGAIKKIADENGLLIIEDAAQAHGAVYMGEKAGAIGDIGCFSFYPSKNMGAFGDAGIVVCKDAELADRVRSLSNHGRSGRYVHSEVGWGHRLDAMQAAILGVKLNYVDRWNDGRREAAGRYDELFSGQSGVVPLPPPPGGVEHVYHAYVIKVADRDGLVADLAEHGVQTLIYYPTPLHMQPALERYGWRSGEFPESEAAANKVLSLPIYPEITGVQQQTVVDTVLSFYG
jgi:dTDP-4-amino-4,6-dideoxygalactose transaminase